MLAGRTGQGESGAFVGYSLAGSMTSFAFRAQRITMDGNHKGGAGVTTLSSWQYSLEEEDEEVLWLPKATGRDCAPARRIAQIIGKRS